MGAVGGPVNLGDRVVATETQVLAILSAANSKDARGMLRAQLLATMLNLRNGSDPLARSGDIRAITVPPAPS